MPGNPITDRKNCEPGARDALTFLPRGIVSGSLVAVRGARWRLTASVEHADCRELHLRGTDGERRVLLWPFDRPAPLLRRPLARLTPPHRWARSAAHLLSHTMAACLPRGRFGGEILPYQLEPAIAVASGVSRVLLADEVGLGKTIQAGWILSDLLAREPDARVLIAVPASLRDQWASELARLFFVDAARVDAAWLRAAVADRAADVSPWAAPGAYLGSIDFLKRPDVAASLSDTAWDLVIVDEAHAAAAPTERHVALSRVAAHARRVVTITATPYSGDAAAFASMAALGGVGGGPMPLMFRRSRVDVGDPRTRRHRFALVRVTGAEARLQRLLERYTREVWTHAPADVEAARLAMTVLRKRALSSAAAAARSLRRRLELLSSVPAAPRQLPLFDEEREQDDELPETAMAVPGLADAGIEQRWLRMLADAADRASSSESKQRYLLRVIARTAPEPIIVFTEYRDTLRHLATALPSALQLHGGLSSAERSAVQRRFNESGGILLATDAAADGLNLQRRCRLLVNYELPWNPARLEQRIGRIDRIGQRRRVHAISLVARDTAEDLVVAALSRRLRRVASTLGEHDRLASFLNEARTARVVIGGETAATLEDVAEAPTLPRAMPGQYEAEAMAAQLRRRTVPRGRGVPVARVRSLPAFGPGCCVLLRAAAVHDGGTVAERTFIAHVPEAAIASTCREELPAFALRAAAMAERHATTLDTIRRWFDHEAAVHRTAIDAWRAREQALREAAAPREQLQPGLFDRRAVDERSRRDGVEARREDEHADRLRRLALAREVRLECWAAAVLVSCP